MQHYKAIVIGTGQAGVPLAKKLAKAGWKTAIIEKSYVGGTCVNYGCTPTKTIIASGRVAWQSRESERWGVHTGEVSVDMQVIRARQNEIVLNSRSGNEAALRKTENLELIFGEARFTGEKQLTIKLNDGGEQVISADYIFINTGAEPIIPNLAGLDEVPYLTSASLLELEEIPTHLLVMGAGYISLEFAQLYKRLGSQVTILEKQERLLIKEDEDVAWELQQILEGEGIKILTGATARKVANAAGNDGVQLTYEANGATGTINCSHLLVATGRGAATKKLALYAAGIVADDHGNVIVNDQLETNVPGVYALGDVKGGPAFTHIAYNDYIIAYQNLIENQNRTTKDRVVPYCMFTDPELGRVGVTEAEAKKQGLNYKVAKISMEKVARAKETGETRGFMKAIVDTDTKQILGAAIIGVQGGEVMTILQMAMLGGITYEQIRYMIFAHPLFAESLNNLFMTIMD